MELKGHLFSLHTVLLCFLFKDSKLDVTIGKARDRPRQQVFEISYSTPQETSSPCYANLEYPSHGDLVELRLMEELVIQRT